jgi:hypothetical protein
MGGMNTTPKAKRWTAASINFLTQDEMRRLLNAIDSKRDYAILDPQEGSCDRTPFEREERKKDQRWQLSAHCPRVFGRHERLAALV